MHFSYDLFTAEGIELAKSLKKFKKINKTKFDAMQGNLLSVRQYHLMGVYVRR